MSYVERIQPASVRIEGLVVELDELLWSMSVLVWYTFATFVRAIS